MEAATRKTSRTQKPDIQAIDWDAVIKVVKQDSNETIPENGITTAKIQSRFSIGSTSAMRYINKMIESGEYDVLYAKIGKSKVRYLIKK